MARTSTSIELPVPDFKVWELIGGFDALPDWLPFIPFSKLSEGGRVRTLTTQDGETVIERLEAFDNSRHFYTYSILQAPFPVTNYTSTLAVHQNDENSSRIEWSGEFTPVGISDDEAITLFRGIYADGLTTLAEKLGDSEHTTQV
ncbi:SRPBCC family protein [Rhodococcus sp. JS3073]|uniref:SRPBCC family protein n=1 Tax=Rhodococcus sp. JS3073 TaxID=3002901 RepID=UPI002285E1F2|nr:SRPBCC family protein [Rhodococcus sp. JS3073]WAM14738.1 SRPBCC family protein [Rhodococcus sp. JS3073]